MRPTWVTFDVSTKFRVKVDSMGIERDRGEAEERGSRGDKRELKIGFRCVYPNGQMQNLATSYYEMQIRREKKITPTFRGSYQG